MPDITDHEDYKPSDDWEVRVRDLGTWLYESLKDMGIYQQFREALRDAGRVAADTYSGPEGDEDELGVRETIACFASHLDEMDADAARDSQP